jgi:putative two-component system response regulator
MKSVLAVDDNLSILSQISVALSGKYKTLLAKDGPTAVKIARSERPRIVLLDIEMHGMDGFETLAALKELPEISRVPVIFLTATHDAATEVRALQSGAVDFITKPVHKSILLHRITMHLQLSDYESDLERKQRELEENIALSFAELIECKEDNVGRHVLRTCKYVELLGAAMLEEGVYGEDLTEDDLPLMARATAFHDIGKIGVSDALLQKTDKLTPEEYEHVKLHTLTGGRVLRSIRTRVPLQADMLHYACLIAEGHHECYDGTGYPQGLSGRDIPLCCRIAAIANVYDSCLSEKIYRPAMTPEEARGVILAGRGLKFDPILVDIFDRCFEKFSSCDVEITPLWNPRKGSPM